MALGAQFDDVLSAARDGAGWALTVLYRELHPSLVRYLRAQVGQEADDVASDVWLGVARSLDRFSGDEGGFRAWVFTIARRRVIDLRRRDHRRRTDATPHHRIEQAAAHGDVEALAIDALASDIALSYLLEGLSREQAEVVLLRIVGDLSVEQTAAIVGRTPGAVRALQHRALARLARKLAAEAPVP